MYQLVAKTGDDKGASWPISYTPLTMGRDKLCDVRIRESIVSRRHCELWLEGEFLRLRDLGSTNATLVNGQPTREAALAVGDEISLGGHVFVITRTRDDNDFFFSSDAGMDMPHTQDLADGLYAHKSDLDIEAQRMPSSVHEFRDLFMLSRRFSRASGVPELSEILAAALREHFAPEALWLAHFLPREGELIFDPLEGNPPDSEPPVQAMREAIEKRTSLLLPRSFHDGSEICYEITLVAPMVLGEDRVGAVALQGRTPQRAYDESDLDFLLAVTHAFAPYLRAAERHDQLRRDYEALRRRTASSVQLIGSSPAFRTAVELLEKAAATKLNVLILGDTGTGKELAARYIHDLSPRAGGPFVAINCAAIPRDLFESEIFGHERGAFTGALQRRIGRFEEAHRGTLFLDEIGDLSPEGQARLLRALESGVFYRVGGTAEVRVDVRVVAATNRAVTGIVGSGQFRGDLYHRLSGFEVRMPALRDRPEDIPALADYFLYSAWMASGRGPSRFSQEAIDRMLQWHWPGNIRELKACVERAAALAHSDVVEPEDILLHFAEETDPDAPDAPLPLAEMEKNHIDRVMRLQGGNIRAAARILGISRPTLYRKIKEYGLDDPEA